MIRPGLLAVTLAVVGCGGGSSNHHGESAGGGGGSPTPSSSTLGGTAAVGAAIQMGTVTAQCSDGSGFTSTVTTNADGAWSGEVDSAGLPCVLTVTGGTPPVTLRGYASQAGTVNITPISDMVLALATGSADGSWVATPANWPDTATVNAKKSELLAAMSDAGFTLPAGDPFTRALVIGDDWDQVLDAIQAAIDDDPALTDYAALVTLVKDGNLAQFPDAPDQGTTDPELPANLSVLTDYAGTYTVIGNGVGDPGYCAGCGTANRDHLRGSVTISAQGDVDFDTGIRFPVADIVAIDDRTDVPTDRRIAVNYGASDSDERIRLYLNSDLEVMEIIHDDGQGTTTRALIQEDAGDPDPEPGAELLGWHNGVAVARDGHVWAIEQPFIETFMATTSKRQIRANNFDDGDQIQDTTPFVGDEQLLWAQVNVAHGNLGTQLCGESTGVSMMTADMDVTPVVWKTWTATECELSVDYHFGNGATEGRIISATLTNDKDTEQVSLSDGQFRIFIHTGKEGPMPALADNLSHILMVDSGTREMRSGYFIEGKTPEDGSHPDHYIDVNVSAGSSYPGVGTYHCDSSSASVSLAMGWVTISSPLFKFQSSNGGACTVTIEQSAARKYVGSYTATLIGPSFDAFGSGLSQGDTELPEAERTLVVHGAFRNFTTQMFHAANQGNEGPLGSEAHGITLTIDDGSTHFTAGETFLLASEPSSNGNNGYFNRPFNELPPPVGELRMVWSEIPMAVGSYACSQDVGGLSPSMTLSNPANIPYGTVYYQSGVQNPTEGASCTLNVTRVDNGEVAGTYSATLVARNMGPVLPGGDDAITVSGEFRYPNTGL
tara:strand:+ start:18362 stop:20863 length:2502 start_codon:yes stop_codon:yes gene_type:complete